MYARDKLKAEAGLSETKMIIGRLFDFQRLLISLPENKFIAWMTTINKLLVEGSSTAKELESTIGRLGHLALDVPGVHHFLSRLRELQQLATRCRSIRLSDDCREDLLLMLWFLEIARQGINMNLVTFCRPTHVYRSDSCPFGLGGYTDECFPGSSRSPKTSSFEHRTTYWNILHQSFLHGSTCWPAASIGGTVPSQ